jgi:uncharacterized membrane protein YhaH (DUF805 family)
VATNPTKRQGPAVLWLLFGLRGRVSRRIYWLACLFIISLQSVILLQVVGGPEASFHDLAAGAGSAALLGSLYCTLAVSVKRLHDVGYAGFLAAAIFIPIVNLAFTIWAGLLPGTAGPNRFGDVADIPPA